MTLGGAREGAGRKHLDASIKRKTRSVVVRDDEWELVKAFVLAVKGEQREQCENFINKLSFREVNFGRD